MALLTQNQKKAIEAAIILKIKKPNLNTFLGKFAVHAVVNQVDILLSNELPQDISIILSDNSKSLTDDEIQHLKEVLPDFLLRNIKNALLQAVLSEIVDIVVDTLIVALQTGKSL